MQLGEDTYSQLDNWGKQRIEHRRIENGVMFSFKSFILGTEV